MFNKKKSKGSVLFLFLFAFFFFSVLLYFIFNTKIEMNDSVKDKKKPLIVNQNIEANCPLYEAEKLQDVESVIDGLRERLREEDKILIIVGIFDPGPEKIISFLKELLEDEESKKVFSFYGSRDIAIFLSNEYSIGKGLVNIKTEDGVKKTAKWLKTGKIE